jgi:hypothetical protein
MTCTAQTIKQTTILSLLIALWLIPAFSEARIVKIVQMTVDPLPAFGGHVFPGVGTYQKITGVAYAEVDPTDRRNSVIVDIGLAQAQAAPEQPGKTTSGKVAYLLNFYILKPTDLNAVDKSLNGYGKVMYEPPNRGGKTWTALGRVSGGGDDPATITNPTILANSFLMPRGYTLVWSGWEPLVPLANLGTDLNASVALPIAKNPGGSTITGPAYEYIVTSGNSFQLSYPAADTADKTTAVLTHRVHLDDVPQVVPAANWNYNSDGTAITLTGGFIANDIYEFSYTAKDPTVAVLALRPFAIGFPGCATRRRMTQARPTRWPTTSPDLYRNILATWTFIQRLPKARLQRRRSRQNRQKGVRRPHAVDRGGQRHWDELSVLAVRPHRAQPPESPICREPLSVRQREDDRSVHGH